ncbi:MAG TPA: glycosyltransferase family 4 protein, partial [Flavisolibacter sp.]|nr:glycosyltransferase family 4 protein [Flavisolibacter sp.]
CVLNEIEQAGKPDYIETQDYHGIGYYLILKKKLGEESLQQIPIVLTAHAPSFFYLKCNQAPVFMLPDYWTGEMEKWTMQAADILLSPSQYLLDNVADDLNGAHEKYEVVRNPYKNLIDKAGAKTFDQEDIVFFGKLTFQKGGLQLLSFMRNLWDEGCEKKISFIGDDHYFEPKQTMMKEFLIKKFQQYYGKGLFSFEGKLNLEELDLRLAKASLIIVPSIVDNFPYAVVESMLTKNVLLISDGGGQSEMVENGKSGFVYKCGNYESFKVKFLEATTLTKETSFEIGEEANLRIASLCNYDAVYAHKNSILKAYSETRQTPYFPFVYELPKSEYWQKGKVEQGKLSIVVPYYNTGDYIAETIQNI